MSDRNINSDKDTAYIQTLLDRLRATLGETAPEEEEGSNPSPSYDTPRTQTVPVTPWTENQEIAEPETTPVTPEAEPLPLSEIPPAVFPQQEEEDRHVPHHDPQTEGADPVPDEIPPVPARPMPEIDPFTPAESPDDFPQEEPVEVPLVAEPAEFPRYEKEPDIILETAAPAVHTPTVQTIEPAPQVEKRVASLFVEEVKTAPAQQEAPVIDRGWRSRQVGTQDGVISHPVGERYRSFPVPDPTVSVPLVNFERDMTAPTLDPDSVDEAPPVFREQISFDVEVPASTPAFDDPPAPDPVPADAPIPDTVEEEGFEAPVEELPEELPEVPAEVIDPLDTMTADAIPADGDSPLALETDAVEELSVPVEDAESAEEELLPTPEVDPNQHSFWPISNELPAEEPKEEESSAEKRTAPIFAFLKRFLSSTGKPSRISDAVPFGVSGIAHAPTEEGKRVHRQKISGELLAARTKLWFGVALLALLLIWELLPTEMETLLSRLLLTRVPGVYFLIDLQLLLLLCFVGYRPIVRGIAAIFRGQILPETLTAIAVLVSVGMESAFYMMQTVVPYALGSLCGLLVVAAIVADYFRIGSLYCAMRVYTTGDSPYVGELSREDGTVSMDVKPASKIFGFAEGTARRHESTASNLITLCIATVSALIVFFVLYGAVYRFNSQLLAQCLWTATTVFCASMPLSLYAVHSILFGMLGKRLAEERVAVSDEGVVNEYAETDRMTFEDTEAFPAGSIRVCGIRLRGDFRMDSAMYLISSLFRRVGGPLDRVFALSTSDVRLSEDVELRALNPDGIEARINGEDFCVGTKEYLQKLGISVYNEAEDERAKEQNNAILCVAYRTQMCAKFYIHYEISRAFEANVEYYHKHGVSTVLCTADPMLSPAFLDSISYVSSCGLRIEKKQLSTLAFDKRDERTSGLISCGPRKTLRRMPFFFRAYRRCRRFLHVMSGVAAVVNAVAVPLMMTLVLSDLFMKVPMAGALCQLFWLIPTVITALVVSRLNPNKPIA